MARRASQIAQVRVLKSNIISGVAMELEHIELELEELPVPLQLQLRLPGLDQERWEWSLRIVTLILAAFEFARDTA